VNYPVVHNINYLHNEMRNFYMDMPKISTEEWHKVTYDLNIYGVIALIIGQQRQYHRQSSQSTIMCIIQPSTSELN
jgi:hypothetical protein